MQRDRHFFTVAYGRSKSATTALTALRFLVEYGRTCDELGEEVTIDVYADHVGLSRSQGFRRQSAFRKCFPADDVLNVWRIVKPHLDRSSFSREAPAAQAVFVGAMKCGQS